MASVLFVDDEESLRRAVRTALGRVGHAVRTAASVARAIRCLELYRFDGLFVDVWLGGASGFDIVSWLENHQPALAKRVVFVTGDINLAAAHDRELRALGLPVLAKPFAIADLEVHIARWIAEGNAGAAQETAAV
jgi:two-component system NtrC family sensor kinase